MSKVLWALLTIGFSILAVNALIHGYYVPAIVFDICIVICVACLISTYKDKE